MSLARNAVREMHLQQELDEQMNTKSLVVFTVCEDYFFLFSTQIATELACIYLRKSQNHLQSLIGVND